MFNSYLNNNCAHCKCILCGWNPHGVKSRQVLMWVNAFMWVVTSAKEEEVRLAWFVCLFVSMIAHKVLYRFAWKCNQRCGSRQFSQSTSESKNSWQDYLRLRVKTKLNIISPQIHKTFEEIWRHHFDFQVNITQTHSIPDILDSGTQGTHGVGGILAEVHSVWIFPHIELVLTKTNEHF